MESLSEDPYQPVVSPSSPKSPEFGLAIKYLSNLLNSSTLNSQAEQVFNSSILSNISMNPQAEQFHALEIPKNSSMNKEAEQSHDTVLDEVAVNPKAKRQNNASTNQILDHPTYDMVHIFEDNGASMKLEKKNISKHQASHQEVLEKKNKLSGSRCMNHKENPKARAKSRANHIIGLYKKMNELKVTTLDETILIAIKDYGTPKEKRKTFASLMELFQKPVEKQSEIELPSQEELLFSSPGKKRLLSKTYLYAVWHQV